MLGAMSPELQKVFENMGAFEINEQLQEMCQEHARQERFQVVRTLIECKHQEGTTVCAHGQKMKTYIDRLRNLNMDLLNELAIDLVLNSLSGAYMENMLMELHGMLKSSEVSMGKPI